MTPITPMKFEVREWFKDVVLDAQDQYNILKYVTWKYVPNFPKPGRSAWYIFSHPAKVKNSHFQFYAAKIKGIGIWNPSNNDFAYRGVHLQKSFPDPIPPTTETYQYTSQIPHIGFDNEGNFTTIFSEESPLGGIIYARAYREYENAKRLAAFDSSMVTIPLMVGEYPEVSFHGKPLGVVVTLVPSVEHYRLNSLLFYNSGGQEDQYLESIFLSLGITGKPQDKILRLNALEKISFLIGKSLSQFSMSGLYRHSGGLDNYFYNQQSNTVLLTDLDSSRDINEHFDHLKSLHVLRDLVSTLYKFFYRLGYFEIVDMYSLEELKKHDFVTSLLEGYSYNRSGAINISAALWNYSIPKIHNLRTAKDRSSSSSDYMKIFSNSGIDRREFYALALLLLSGCYNGTSISVKYPLRFTQGDILNRAQVFLGQQFRNISEYL